MVLLFSGYGGSVVVCVVCMVCSAVSDARCVCVQDAAGEDQAREKRKLEGVTQAKFGIKNAVLGFVFGVSRSTVASNDITIE